MKLLIVGGSGTIGKKVTSYFSDTNEVITAGHRTFWQMAHGRAEGCDRCARNYRIWF